MRYQGKEISDLKFHKKKSGEKSSLFFYLLPKGEEAIPIQHGSNVDWKYGIVLSF